MLDDFLVRDTYFVVGKVGRWMFLLGAMLGSFMNVVVYRLPRRMSLS